MKFTVLGFSACESLRAHMGVVACYVEDAYVLRARQSG